MSELPEYENFGWYVIKIVQNQSFTPSGHCIAQYIDGIFYEEQTEVSVNEEIIEKIIRKL